MRKYRIMYLFALLIMVCLTIESNGKEALFFLVLLLLFPLFTGTAAWIGGKKIKLMLKVPVFCMLGQETEISFQLTKNKRILIGKIELPVSFENPLFGDKEEKQLIICPGQQAVTEYFLPLETDRCGKVKIRQTEICYYDVLGLFRFKKASRQEQSIYIYPKQIPLHILLNQRPLSMETGDIFDEKVRGQDVSEIFDLRNYQIGDSIRTIHWKLSSKMDDLLVREFSRPANYNTIILFEFARKADRKKDTYQIINVTASLVLAVMRGLLRLNMGHQVGYVAQGELMETAVDSKDDLIQMMDNMMSMKNENDDRNLIQTFMKLELYRQYTKVIYITGKFDEKSVTGLCNLVNLSVIVPWEGQEDYLDSSAGYDILSLSANEMEKNAIYLYI